MNKIVSELAKNFVLRKIGEDVFLIPLDKAPENLFLLNSSAAYIWKKLLSGFSITECAKKLSKEFSIQEGIIEADIKKLLAGVENGLTEKVNIKNINKKSKLARIPIQGSFDLTGRCNLDCLHCYAKGERKRKELSLVRIKKIVDQLVKNGCLFLQLTGGECLMRKDFKEIYFYIRRAGIIPTISTNATLFNNDLINLFKKYPPYQVVVSVYGAKSFVHDQITRVDRSFRRTLTNVKKLKKAGIFVWFSAVVMKQNFSKVSEMKKLAQKIGVPIVFYPFLIPRLDKNKTPLIYCINDKQCFQILDFNKKTKPFQRVKQIKRRKKEIFYPCNAGLQSFHIDAEGKVRLCKIERSIGFSLFESSFKACLQKLSRVRNSKLRLSKTCLDCSYRIDCRVCPPMMRLYQSSGCGKLFCQRVKIDKNLSS